MQYNTLFSAPRFSDYIRQILPIGSVFWETLL